MMWGGGDGSSDATNRPTSNSGLPDSVPGGAAGAAGMGAGMGAMGRNGEASDQEMYGQDQGQEQPGPDGLGDEAVRGRGYNEELGWGQDGWENDNEELMDDPFQQEPGVGSDDGWFGGGGGGGGDWGDWS